MMRLFWTSLLIVEGVVIAVIVTMIAGMLPASISMLTWAGGIIVILATAFGFGLPNPRGVVLYGALTAGALVFMLPFIWLLSTSFKEPSHTFTYPPQWLPTPAAVPVQSPWHDPTEHTTHKLLLGQVSLHGVKDIVVPVKMGWQSQGPAHVETAKKQHHVVSYDFEHTDHFRISAKVAVPTSIKKLKMVSIQFRPDASWHSLAITIEYAGHRWVNNSPLYLGSGHWLRWFFAVRQVEGNPRAMGIWPMKQVGPSDVKKGTVRVTLNVTQNDPRAGTWAKWTQSYRDAWYADQHWPDYIFNSVYLVILNVIGQMLACSLAAFAFSRLHWPGREWVFGLVLATMMLPPAVIMIPQFLIFKSLGFYNTLVPLWLPAFIGTPFFIFLLRQFMLTLPNELEESARLDGCSWFGIYWRITLPLLKPALAAVAVFTFMAVWNEFMGPLIYLSDPRLYPLPLGLYNFRTEHGGQFNMLMAASTLITLPAVALFFMAQRYFIEGVTLTGMKG